MKLRLQFESDASSLAETTDLFVNTIAKPAFPPERERPWPEQVKVENSPCKCGPPRCLAGMGAAYSVCRAWALPSRLGAMQS